MKKLYVLILILSVLGCGNRNEKKEKGFIVFDNPRLWYFVPVKSLDEDSCIADFSTENLNMAFKFQAFQSIPLIENLDTVQIEEPQKGESSLLKIVPVAMEYKVDNITKNENNRSKFKVKVKGTYVEFVYDIVPIEITKVTPLNCYNKQVSDVIECECQKRNDDPNDYLFKTCTYLKLTNNTSKQACRYEISAITETTYNGKKAIEVSFNCCYLGDRAYFDPKTKKLISFAYGAE